MKIGYIFANRALFSEDTTAQHVHNPEGGGTPPEHQLHFHKGRQIGSPLTVRSTPVASAPCSKTAPPLQSLLTPPTWTTFFDYGFCRKKTKHKINRVRICLEEDGRFYWVLGPNWRWTLHPLIIPVTRLPVYSLIPVYPLIVPARFSCNYYIPFFNDTAETIDLRKTK